MAHTLAPGHFECRKKSNRARFAILAATALLVLPARLVVAQDAPRVTAVDPPSGKANATITVSGENLEKAQVTAVFLSDDKDDFKATVVSQTANKITIRVPEVKPGDYNISIQAGSSILIEPVRFTVQI